MKIKNSILYCSSRMIEVQVGMAQRAIELLALPEDTPSYILDVGYAPTNLMMSSQVILNYFVFGRCGSGLSGEALSEEGHYWVGVDISRSMLGQQKFLFYYCYKHCTLFFM